MSSRDPTYMCVYGEHHTEHKHNLIDFQDTGLDSTNIYVVCGVQYMYIGTCVLQGSLQPAALVLEPMEQQMFLS